jgi:hypothetical protein
MPGRKDANLRSGDLQEDLGILLLKRVGLVAPVPRPEDAGVDAVVTLLRQDTTRHLIPEDTFFVQLKASSVREVDYETEDEVRWLMGLELPLFIGSVRLADAAIDLYPTHSLQRVQRETKSIRKYRFQLDQLHESSGSLDLRLVTLGPPAASWSVAQLSDPDFPRRAYAILKTHIAISRENIRNCPIGHFEALRWDTNEVPVRDDGFSLAGGPGSNPTIYSSLAPPLRALFMELCLMPNQLSHVGRLLDFLELLRELGAAPCPVEFATMALLKATPEQLADFGAERIARLDHQLNLRTPLSQLLAAKHGSHLTAAEEAT